MNSVSRRSSLSPRLKLLCNLALAILLALMAGCASPVFRNLDKTIAVAPIDVQQSTESFEDAEVIWGGRIVSVDILEGSTRVEVIAFPLNRAQQPVPDAESIGRFVLVVPGIAGPPDYAPGRHLTAQGVIAGIWRGQLDGRVYPYPLLKASAVNIWPWGFMFDTRPQISIGVGVGIGSQLDK